MVLQHLRDSKETALRYLVERERKQWRFSRRKWTAPGGALSLAARRRQRPQQKQLTASTQLLRRREHAAAPAPVVDYDGGRRRG